MIFSGQRNTSGSVGAETSEGPNTAPLSQQVASNLSTNASHIVSATVKPVPKPSVVQTAKSKQPVIASVATATFSTVGKWQPSQATSTAASRPSGSWW